jgi:hypothetical protein
LDMEPDSIMAIEPRATMLAGQWVHDSR